MAVRRARHAPRAGGQHFLRSARLAADLVRDAVVEPTDWVVELGAGSGRLTAALASCVGRVDAVELDAFWAARLRDRFGGRPNVRVIEGDAARARLPDVAFRVIANLPFNRTGAILRRLLDDPRLPLQRADLIVEWGVALKRTARWPSTMANIRWGAWYELVLVRRLPAALFEPKPQVDAGLLRIVRRPEPLVPVADHDRFCAVLEAGFTSRPADVAAVPGGIHLPAAAQASGPRARFRPRRRGSRARRVPVGGGLSRRPLVPLSSGGRAPFNSVQRGRKGVG